MKIKLDENLPVSLVAELSALNIDVHSVKDEGLCGASDDILWRYCCSEERFLITQDLDFSDVNKFPPGSHPGILILRLKEPSRRNLHQYLVNLFNQMDVTQWSGMLIIATDNKIRIRR